MKRIVQCGLMMWMLSVVLGSAPIALAQEAEPGQRPERLRDLREKVEQAKHRKLREALALDENTAPKFFEKYRVAEQEIQELSRQRNEEMRKLYQLMQGAGKDEEVDPAMERVRTLTEQIQNRQLRLDSELKPILSPRQRARLLAFEQEFNRRVREHMMKKRMGNRGHQVDKEKRRQMEERIKRIGREDGKGEEGPRRRGPKR
jgi:hypothetical protein